MEVWTGNPYPLGATYDGSGTNFAVFSEAASAVHLCLFDEDGAKHRISLEAVDASLALLSAPEPAVLPQVKELP